VSQKTRGRRFYARSIGDGALGFWAALRSTGGFEQTKEQRCWVHKIANVLDKMPKRVQPDTKSLLHEMMYSPTKLDALKVRSAFEKLYGEKYIKSTECLVKSWTELTAFYNFPVAHWSSLRTTNPIESSFATVKLRTKVTKGAGNKDTAAAMAFKLLKECEKRWYKIRGSAEDMENIVNKLAYQDGIVIAHAASQEAAAS
jgi:putative transposase